MSSILFTSVDRILAKISKELRGTDISELDIIDWIGEAMDFMEVPEIQERVVVLLPVKNYEVLAPAGFKTVIQVTKYVGQIENDECVIPKKEEEEYISDCGCEELIKPKIFNTLEMDYSKWSNSGFYKRNFIPINLSSHNYFDSVVCHDDEIYKSCDFEYNVVGTFQKKLRFSFKDGIIALAYYRTAIDKDTGFPLIPDSASHINAANYYVRWKIAERLDWDGREGFASKEEKNRKLWEKYVKQAKNWSKMPKSFDEHLNMLHNTYQIVPRLNRQDNYFSSIKSKYTR